ncbi:MAG: hypothetical protein DYG96_13230 [Chlorobi bacterium CHB2]|nr:hypothetical protein [Chlorobi bacterium CHB2]
MELPTTLSISPHHLSFFFFGMIGAIPCGAIPYNSICRAGASSGRSAIPARNFRKKGRDRKVLLLRRAKR